MWDSVTPMAFVLLQLLFVALLLSIILSLTAKLMGYQMLFKDLPALKFYILE